MSSISAASSSYLSPLQLLQQELKTEVTSGTIASSDQDALSSALTAIDSSLTSDRSAGTKPPSKEEMDAKISDLIDTQVSAGNLTSEQASELKDLFSSTFSAQGAGGPPPGPPPSDSESTSSTDSTSSSSSTTDISQILQEFLQMLKDSQTSSSSSYSADGGNSSSTSVQALLINYTA
uniref:Uncharacterized protein n=1 Tax=Rhodopseudomonas palustris (strain BisA53) TaxID=316055 RepID=Q07J09_RHOP5